MAQAAWALRGGAAVPAEALFPVPALLIFPTRGPSHEMTCFEVNGMARQQPIAKFRAGSISCALFENDIKVDGGVKPILKATVARRYKDQDLSLIHI